MVQLVKNNAKSTLDSSITDVATSLILATGGGTAFPTISGSDYFLVTLYDLAAGNETNHEIMKVTARSGDVLTVTRAQEGTAARAFNAGTNVQLRMTAGTVALKTDLIAAAIVNVPTGSISAGTVQAALDELGSEKLSTTDSYGRNILINGNFAINFRSVSGTVTLAAGAYGHNGFKAGAGGCTYTFAKALNKTTVTISAGTLVQIADGNKLQSGTYTIGYDGTAPVRIDGGAWGASGMTATAVGGTNQTIEWGVGTLSLTQYEPGTIRTRFEFRDDEAARCQYYLPYIELRANSVLGTGAASSATTANIQVNFPVPARIPPTGVTLTGGVGSYYLTDATYNALTCSAAVLGYAGLNSALLAVTSATGVASGTLMAATTTVGAYFTGVEL